MPPQVPPPARILFIRPDTYGDLVLFEPVLRRLRAAWGERTEIAVLIREPFLDLSPLVAVPGVRWLTVPGNPYRDAVDGPAAEPTWRALRRVLEETFRPDCLVAPCVEKTWLEAAAGMLRPDARQVSHGRFDLDPAVLDATTRTLERLTSSNVPDRPGFAEFVETDGQAPEWRRQAALTDYLLGAEPVVGEPDDEVKPRLVVPPEARATGAAALAAKGLTAGTYAVCAAAGVANVVIKAWGPERYGEILSWLGRAHGVPALLVGHEREAERLETVRRAARSSGGPEPALWLGRDGEMPILAALIGDARFYLGNDTGAVHLAAALDRPLVSVYGGGAGLRFRPAARANAWTVVQPLPCFGCAWDCFFGDAPCVGTIQPASVRAALERLLAAEGGGAPSAPEILEVEGLSPDARSVVERVTPRFQAVRAESASRHRQVCELNALARRREPEAASLHAKVARGEAEAEAHLAQMAELQRLLTESETDRHVRGEQITRLTAQMAELQRLLTESETDRHARGQQITRLTAWLKESETDRNACREQIAQLTAWLKESETDRKARGEQIIELTALCRAAQAGGGVVPTKPGDA